jgi:hypothetical protein
MIDGVRVQNPRFLFSPFMKGIHQERQVAGSNLSDVLIEYFRVVGFDGDLFLPKDTAFIDGRRDFMESDTGLLLSVVDAPV